MSEQLTIADYESIRTIVDSLASNYEDEIKVILLERFYDLFRLLNDTQKNLIKNLSKKFCNIRVEKYINYIFNIINNNFNERKISHYDNIFAIPISSKPKESMIKSGSIVAYYIPRIINMLYSKNIDANIIALQNIECLSAYENRNNSLIIFCDEFIGSGKQAKRCLENYEKFKKLDNDDIIILSIFILKDGYSLLSNKYDVMYYDLYEKGISDDSSLMKNNALKIMREIEELIQVPKTYRFGAGRSEGLISFELKAPNNTFPIYWYKGNSKRQPVFER